MRALLSTALLVATVACRQDMHDQPKYKSLRASPFFADGRTSRPAIPGTVPRGGLAAEGPHATGKSATGYVVNPLARTPATLARGRERYDVFCAPCHDRAGTGHGMIVERGYRQPPTFHQERLRTIADGYLVEVIARGFGVMPSHSAQIPADDRWAIAAWIRVLQKSQWATLADVPADERLRLQRETAHP
jgi:mono/diheme cytochrome c family protein